jgi:hypothetical protein
MKAHIYTHVQDRVAYGRRIYELFIREDAPLQVNISGTDRRGLVYMETLGDDDDEGSDMAQRQQHALDGTEFHGVVKQVRLLLMTNYWRLFCASRACRIFCHTFCEPLHAFRRRHPLLQL